MTETVHHGVDDGPLAARLRAIAPGSRVVLAAGVHRGPLALTQDVELVAAGGLGSATIASSRGPAVSMEGAGRVLIENIVLRGPDAGAAAVVQVYVAVDLTLRGCLLSGGRGRGEGGGGIDIQQGRVRIERCRITRCTAPQGGAIRAAGAVLVEIESTIFADNHGAVAGGGAVFATRGAIVKLVGATFAGNRGLRGSAVLSGGGSGGGGVVELRSCLVAADADGDALWAEQGGTLGAWRCIVPRPPGDAADIDCHDGIEVRSVDVEAGATRPFTARFTGLLSGRGAPSDFSSTLDVYAQRREAIWLGAVG